MTKKKRRLWTILLAVTFPVWVIPAVSIFWMVTIAVIVYEACSECVEMIEDLLLNKSKSKGEDTNE